MAIELGLLALVVLALAAFYYARRVIKPLIYNSIVGLVVLFVVNTIGIVDVAYTPLAIIVIALGGVPGAVLVILLAFLDVAFVPALLI